MSEPVYLCSHPDYIDGVTGAPEKCKYLREYMPLTGCGTKARSWEARLS